MKRRSFLAGTAAAAGLATTGCGNLATSDPNTITFMFRGGIDERAAYDQAIAEFERLNDVTVNVIVTNADQYDTKLQAAILGQKTPDVFYFDSGKVKAYAINEVLQDMTPYLEGTGAAVDELWPLAVDLYRYDGELQGQGDAIYGLPKDIGPFSFGYNRTMFEAAGLPLPDPEVPYTWDEFVDVCQALTVDLDGDGELDQWGTGLNVTWNLQALVWSNGGDWSNEAATEVTVDTPEFAEALQYFADLQNVHGVTPSIAESQTLDTYQRWMRGQIGFFPVAPWDLSTYRELDFEWDLIPYPAGSTGSPSTWIGSLGIGVSATTSNPEMATRLAAYLSADPDTQALLVDAGIQLSNIRSTAIEWASDDTYMPVNKEEMIRIVEDYGRPLPGYNTYNAEWYTEFFTNIQPVLDGKQTAAEYCTWVQPRMQDLLDAANEQEKFDRGEYR
ncbi:ABC transporter substrate-binding protein [Brachybacterium sp. DNPG3]